MGRAGLEHPFGKHRKCPSRLEPRSAGDRLLHAYGKSYPDSVKVFSRDFAHAPDVGLARIVLSRVDQLEARADNRQAAAGLDDASGVVDLESS